MDARAFGGDSKRVRRAMRSGAQRAPTRVAADFPGSACPVGSSVRFRRRGGGMLSGRVAALHLRHAAVDDGAGGRWRVAYAALEVLERAGGGCSLAAAAALAEELLARHKLAPAWRFGFDLAPARAGICRYAERRIDLSASFCLAAGRAEIADTLLHEIAHALVGPGHGHDAVWQAAARSIGASGRRTHGVHHAAARWIGECGCGRRWHRQRLQRRIANRALCPTCRGPIAWRSNAADGDSGARCG